tara:strand:- start:321 stop:665 length:345 start_codon:yes stop_codon:yes gene_type:complete
MSAYNQVQNNLESNWSGEWVAEGTIFKVRVEAEDSDLTVYQIESMGFDWTNEIGELKENIATINVEYAGVKGIIQVEFIDETTASVFAASCIPEYMVVCLLAKDQKAVFKKVLP